MPNDNRISVTDSITNDRIYRIGQPELIAYLAPDSNNTGAAIMILLGGGYARQATFTLMEKTRAWYNALGVNVFVLKYRLPQNPNVIVSHTAPIEDAQRGMRYIRAHAAEWKVDPEKIGAMGFSAGGHLASTLGTHLVDYAAVGDALDTLSFQPDFLVLISPVITMGENTHHGSRDNLLGMNPAPELLRAFSSELHVHTGTPPAFLVHASNDPAVPVVNSLSFAKALANHGVSFSLHIFPQGGHNIGMDNNPGSTESWTFLCAEWLREMKFL